MRPSHVESIRGIQAALAEAIAPELRTEFAQNVMQTIQMLLESLASCRDTEASDLQRDNQVILDLLSQSAGAIRASGSNDLPASLVSEIESGVRSAGGESINVSALSARNDELRATLERVLVTFEKAGGPEYEGLLASRRAMYGHLRDVAARGWSFWDAASFRERMQKERPA